ncbi:MAG: glutamyl-tRNA amidotransferase [Gammaproteobacteria bacterium RIFCSPHIGHO2_02_FULL_42_13]|nr:MAG: glutamyl-tRNA amidotransferase [Gammaproteobacteria bacterium RIFCSPHIGHO2_02_FULL_42_13]
MTEDKSYLKACIQTDMKNALRAHDKERLGAIRLIFSAIRQHEIDHEHTEADDAQVMAILEKMIKQRRDSIAQFTQAGRNELVQKEEAEIAIIQTYLPAPLSEVELDTLIKTAITQTQATTMKDMGKVMGILKPKIQGRAEMGHVSAKIKTLLS